MYCRNTIFSMKADIYYSTEEQDDFGALEKTWREDQTLAGYFEILGVVSKDSIKNGGFFDYQDKLIGRFKVDPRVSIEGIMHSITSMLITNIRNAKNFEEFYIEAVGSRSGESTIYEISAVEPHVNPWNKIEYYKVLLNRSDSQEINK
jgi:hypothetical protein